MTEEPRGSTASRIFAAALEQPAHLRESFVADRCGDDLALREEVLALLAADASAGDFLDNESGRRQLAVLAAEVARDAAAGSLADPKLGRRVGAYRLTERIGAGGMGAVYLAERTDGDFAQRVAVKLVKRGLDSEELLLRFRRERRLLAQLEHPHIGRLIDGGTLDDGQPYLVMEHVDGEPIDTYCQGRDVPLRDRLALFLEVCAAVDHAHRQLVVHRDLKPSNVLVTGNGSCKLLDFGIAKLLDADAEDLPADAPGGAITLLGARRLGRLSLGLRAMLTSHFDGEDSTEDWSRGESLYIHSFGVGGRLDLSDRWYGDVAAEVVNTRSDATEEDLWTLPASNVWTGWAARTRWFWAAGDKVVLVPSFDLRADDRRVLSTQIDVPADQDAWQASAGLGVNLLRDPDNLVVVSGAWRWGSEHHVRLRGQSTGWEYDQGDLDYHEIHARVGLESRVLPWLSVRGSLQYHRLQREQALARGDLVQGDPDRWSEQRTIVVQTPITLGCSLHAGPFQADLVLNAREMEVPGTLPFGARATETRTLTGVTVRYLF